MGVMVGRSEGLSDIIDQVWINEMVLLKPLQPYLHFDKKNGEYLSLIPEELKRHNGNHTKNILTTLIKPLADAKKDELWHFYMIASGSVLPTEDLDFYYITLNPEGLLTKELKNGYKPQKVDGTQKTIERLRQELGFYNNALLKNPKMKIDADGAILNISTGYPINGSAEAKRCMWGNPPSSPEAYQGIYVEMYPFLYKNDDDPKDSHGITVFKVSGKGKKPTLFRFAYSSKNSIVNQRYPYDLKDILEKHIVDKLQQVAEKITFYREITFLLEGHRPIFEIFKQLFIDNNIPFENLNKPSPNDTKGFRDAKSYHKNWEMVYHSLLKTSERISFGDKIISDSIVIGRPHGFEYVPELNSPNFVPFYVSWYEHGLNTETAQGTHILYDPNVKDIKFRVRASNSCGACAAERANSILWSRVETLEQKVQEVDTLRKEVQQMDALKQKVQEVDALKEEVQQMQALKQKIQEMNDILKKKFK